MLSVRNNMMASRTARTLGVAYEDLADGVRRLSSGLRISSSRDDAAGQAVSELLRADVAQLRQAGRNAQDGISMLQVAEGSLAVINDILVRMRGLAEQASTDTYSDTQRSVMDEEFQQLSEEIERIAKSTKYNGMDLLGDDLSYDFHLGSGDTAGGVSLQTTFDAKDILVISRTTTSVTFGAVADPADDSVGNQFLWATNPSSGMQFVFDKDGTVEIDLANSERYSLNEFVDLINASSQQVIDGWDAASVHDNGDGTYGLTVTGYSAGTGNDLNVIEISPNQPFGGWFANQLNPIIDQGETTRESIGTIADATQAINEIDEAIANVEGQRSRFGSTMNRLEMSQSVLQVQSESLLSAQSRIADVDMAQEMAVFTRNNVLAQAGISLLSQANSMPEIILSLIQN